MTNDRSAMNFKQRLCKLEKIAQGRLAAAAAEAALSLEEDPPLTEQEARSLDLNELLRQVMAELQPAKVRESVEFGQRYAHFRRLPLRELLRLYLALKRRLRKVQSRR